MLTHAQGTLTEQPSKRQAGSALCLAHVAALQGPPVVTGSTAEKHSKMHSDVTLREPTNVNGAFHFPEGLPDCHLYSNLRRWRS